MENRIISLDIARGLSVIWIVGILHVIGYVMNPSLISTPILKIIEGVTISCLATFTYLSGYFVAGKEFHAKNDLRTFFKKRILRFAILYFIACISLYVAGILLSNDVKWFFSLNQLIATLIGISGLIPNYQPATFWYFSMIILFYIVTPYIICAKSKTIRLIRSVLIFSLLMADTILLSADYRLPFYFIFYVYGSFSSDLKPLKGKYIFIMFILFIIVSLTINLDYYFSIQNLAIGGIGLWVIISLSSNISNPKLTSLFSFLAYSSMCAYLYHRHLYALIKKTYSGDYWPIYIWPIIIVMVFLMGYIIQLIYDRCINRLKKS